MQSMDPSVRGATVSPLHGLIACAQVQEDKSRRERFVLSVAHSPDGQRLACGAMDGTVCVFDTTTGAVVSSMQGHFKPVRSLTFMPGSSSRSSCGGGTGEWCMKAR
jgi:WD40 repeat protein